MVQGPEPSVRRLHFGLPRSPARMLTKLPATDRSNAMRGPRFEQAAMELQPQPLAAIELIAEEPIRLVPTRIAACDGGESPLHFHRLETASPSGDMSRHRTSIVQRGQTRKDADDALGSLGSGALGHPKVYINLDKPGPKACG